MDCWPKTEMMQLPEAQGCGKRAQTGDGTNSTTLCLLSSVVPVCLSSPVCISWPSSWADVGPSLHLDTLPLSGWVFSPFAPSLASPWTECLWKLPWRLCPMSWSYKCSISRTNKRSSVFLSPSWNYPAHTPSLHPVSKGRFQKRELLLQCLGVLACTAVTEYHGLNWFYTTDIYFSPHGAQKSKIRVS